MFELTGSIHQCAFQKGEGCQIGREERKSGRLESGKSERKKCPCIQGKCCEEYVIMKNDEDLAMFA